MIPPAAVTTSTAVLSDVYMCTALAYSNAAVQL